MDWLECSLDTWTEVAGNLVYFRADICQKFTASRTVPVFLLHKGVKVGADELAAIACLMNTNLAEAAYKDLIILKIVVILANITGDLSLITVFRDDDVLDVCF